MFIPSPLQTLLSLFFPQPQYPHHHHQNYNPGYWW